MRVVEDGRNMHRYFLSSKMWKEAFINLLPSYRKCREAKLRFVLYRKAISASAEATKKNFPFVSELCTKLHLVLFEP